MVADARDGQPLAASGPFELIVSDDKRPARWVHNLVAITVQNAPQTFIGMTWGGSSGGVLFAEGVDYTSYIVGLTVPVGQSASFFGSWSMAQPNATTASAIAGAGNQNTYHPGDQYKFTQRTNMYVAASYATGPGLVSGVSSTLYVTGIRHQF